ncbi:MAG TPA: DUF4013 domain-containing protein [Candidatus Obscuribacterales bacterium]
MTSEVAVVGIDADKAVRQFTVDSVWKQKIGFGSMLTAAWFLIAIMDVRTPLFLPVALAIAGCVTGYLLRVVRERIQFPDAKRLPEWDEWADLFMSGITWIAIQFGICVLAMIMITSTLILSIYAAITPNAYSVVIAETSLIVIVLVALWTSFLSTFLWVNFAIEERVTAAIDLGKVREQVRRNPGQFWMAWALSCSLQFIAIVIPAMTVIGIVLIPTTFFAAQILSAHLLVQAWTSVEN